MLSVHEEALGHTWAMCIRPEGSNPSYAVMPVFFLSSKLRSSDSCSTSSPTLLQIATLSSKLSLQDWADDWAKQTYASHAKSKAQHTSYASWRMVQGLRGSFHLVISLQDISILFKPGILGEEKLTLCQLNLAMWVCWCFPGARSEFQQVVGALRPHWYWALRPCCCKGHQFHSSLRYSLYSRAMKHELLC